MPRKTKRGGSPVTVRSKTMKTRGAGRKRRRVEERADLTAKHSKQSEDIRPIVGPSDSMAPTAGNPSGAPGPSTSDSGTIRHGFLAYRVKFLIDGATFDVTWFHVSGRLRLNVVFIDGLSLLWYFVSFFINRFPVLLEVK
ncbi:uncharacterized protein LOC125377994 [Haliotis rufescens]|uniref:uncharacterized protein LOC125377994 n=1 Tax=Haliotis rufescens TaxID=6454 RepID=UPI00201E986E|nr:uncharacterized protein LOC125377994 [Haliotis rufescens]